MARIRIEKKTAVYEMRVPFHTAQNRIGWNESEYGKAGTSILYKHFVNNDIFRFKISIEETSETFLIPKSYIVDYLKKYPHAKYSDVNFKGQEVILIPLGLCNKSKK